MLLQKDKKHKILRRVEGQQPQNHVQGFFCCPFGLLMVTYRLRILCALQKCRSILFFFTFGLLFCFFGGCVSFFVSMFVFIVLFVFDSVVSLSCIFSLCDQKTQIKSQNI